MILPLLLGSLAAAVSAAPTRVNATASASRFLNQNTQEFLVQSMPLVNETIGEMYAGSIYAGPQSDDSLFFIFKPKEGNDPVDEVTIWLNGGPGCTSLFGFLQENGPYLWQAGAQAPVKNIFSWDTVTNMLWVDQPFGTGFSTGTPYARNQQQTADAFLLFFKKWQETFGITNYKIYVTGESYAGRYVPYIGAAMIAANDTTHFDLKGAMIYDPTIGDLITNQQMVTYPFVEKNIDLYGFDATQMATLQRAHETCGYASTINEFLTYPPPSDLQPLNSAISTRNCDLFSSVYTLARQKNPCYNPYMIVDHCPYPYDPMGAPTGAPPPAGQTYFQRPDVVAAFHAPTNITFQSCAEVAVFPLDDQSADSIQTVLPQVIEHTNRVLIANGDWDSIVVSQGVLLSIQNMTWNGMRGFQREPNQTFYSSIPLTSTYDTSMQGAMGTMTLERGLLWMEVIQAGHMIPQYQPRVALQQLWWVLGYIEAAQFTNATSAASNTSLAGSSTSSATPSSRVASAASPRTGVPWLVSALFRALWHGNSCAV